MSKIVLLQSLPTTKRVFNDKQLESLEQIGEVHINQDQDKVQKESVRKLLQNAEIAITSWGCPKIDSYLLDSAPRLKVVLHAAGTVKSIVSPQLWERGIRVSSAADALGKGVAETALGLMIVSLKNIWQLAKNTREGEWSKGKNEIREVYGLTVGVIGAGRAGRHFIRLLKNFDVKILLNDPTVTEKEVSSFGAQKVELKELLSQSDVVSIHAPSIPETNHLLNHDSLQWMKDEAILINTARGSIIDEEALIAELNKGRLFACLDVTKIEPPHWITLSGRSQMWF
ncbi:hydroxyacid dehydrogenase [Lederbergia sp. NSJ-179]|uniref:hydroxyacid dehydrogenase n=1 Tax=Lederbergia sp. NSJ-179 TaxID=2931402 RepID=UPI001FD592D9|nr:hydroxyacid dehydrogenase [Lederbergia sp. NSJ-179]MCJ7841224.1 hydroxyacid dehydrogenase [Lederbergia sp. NSJ-179]